MPLMIKATSLALAEFPILNASVSDDGTTLIKKGACTPSLLTTPCHSPFSPPRALSLLTTPCLSPSSPPRASPSLLTTPC